MEIGRRQLVWPKVIGIIAIVFGSIGTLNYAVCGPVVLLVSGSIGAFLEKLAQSQPGQGLETQAAQFEAMGSYIPANLAVSCFAALLAVTLLIGGIGLVRQRPWAARAIVIWAILKMLHAAPAAMVTYLTQMASFRAMREAAETSPGGPGQVPPGFFAILEAAGIGGMVASLLWYWALPAFMLIWFSRRKIRDDMIAWRSPPNEQFAQ